MHCSGVPFDPRNGNNVDVFGAQVSSEVARSRKRAGKKHPVSLTELYAVCVARQVWKDLFDNCKCVCFVDNQGDVDDLIKGDSSEDTMKILFDPS